MHWLSLFAQDDAGLGGLFAGGACLIVWAILAIVGFVIWIYALIKAIKDPTLDSTMKLVWVLVIVFTGIIGAVIYLIAGKNISKSA